MLANDDDDDVFDEDTGEGPVDEVADDPARGAREVETRGEGALSPELEDFLKSLVAGDASDGDEEGSDGARGEKRRVESTSGAGGPGKKRRVEGEVGQKRGEE